MNKVLKMLLCTFSLFLIIDFGSVPYIGKSYDLFDLKNEIKTIIRPLWNKCLTLYFKQQNLWSYRKTKLLSLKSKTTGQVNSQKNVWFIVRYKKDLVVWRLYIFEFFRAKWYGFRSFQFNIGVGRWGPFCTFHDHFFCRNWYSYQKYYSGYHLQAWQTYFQKFVGEIIYNKNGNQWT